MPHSELHPIKIISVFGVLAICTIEIDHIRARAIDPSVLLLYMAFLAIFYVQSQDIYAWR